MARTTEPLEGYTTLNRCKISYSKDLPDSFIINATDQCELGCVRLTKPTYTGPGCDDTGGEWRGYIGLY